MQHEHSNIPGPPAAGGSFEWSLRIQRDGETLETRNFRRSEVSVGTISGMDIFIEDPDFHGELCTLRVDLTGRLWIFVSDEDTTHLLEPGVGMPIGDIVFTLVQAPKRAAPLERHVPNPEQHNTRKRPDALLPDEPASYALTLELLEPGHDTPQTLAFEGDREIDIGRAGERMISLPHVGIGRLHCTLIISDRGEVFIRDHCSMNGTLINKRNVADIAVWLPGEELTVGEAVLTYETPPRPLNDAAWRLCHQTKRTIRQKRYMPHFGCSKDPEAEWEVAIEIRDRVESRGAELINYDMIFTRDTIHIGRSRRNDLVLPAPSTSKRHAIITVDHDGALEIECISQVNPVYLAGEPIQGRVALEALQVIRIGLYTMRVLEVRRP